MRHTDTVNLVTLPGNETDVSCASLPSPQRSGEITPMRETTSTRKSGMMTPVASLKRDKSNTDDEIGEVSGDIISPLNEYRSEGASYAQDSGAYDDDLFDDDDDSHLHLDDNF